MDRYSKIVLTVIAVALSVIAVRDLTPGAAALGEACGSFNNPCEVNIHNWPAKFY